VISSTRWLAPLALLALLTGCGGESITIVPDTLPPAVSGRYFDVKLSARGTGVDHMSANQLPQGLRFVFSGRNGLLFGTPTAEGVFDVVVSAGGNPTMVTRPPSVARTYQVVVGAQEGSPDEHVHFDDFVLLEPDVGRAYTFDFASADVVGGGQGPYRFAYYCIRQADFCANSDEPYNSPPAGFTLTESGVLAGTLARAGRYDFIVCAIDQRGEHACGPVRILA
jgi:hypothetical protein